MAQGTADRDGPLGGIRGWLAQTARVLSGSTMTVTEYDPKRHDRLVSFDGLDGYEELDRYWLNAPFAFASVNYDPEESEHYYHVVEPALSDLERRLLDRLFDEVRDPLLYREDVAEDPEAALREELHERLEEYGVSVAEESFYRLFYYLYRAFQGYGKLDPLMHDPHIEDISCDGPGLPVFIYHDQYTDIETSSRAGISLSRTRSSPRRCQRAPGSNSHSARRSPRRARPTPSGSTPTSPLRRSTCWSTAPSASGCSPISGWLSNTTSR